MMFRKATVQDLPAVGRIYEDTHTELEAGNLTIGWIRGIYPTAETAAQSLDLGELFVAEDRGEIVGTAVINQRQVDVYAQVQWEHDAPADQVMVLHTLVIAPQKFGAGYGRRFVEFYEQYAREQGCLYLRLDANRINEKARRLYNRLGYREVGDAPCEFRGLPDIHLVMLEKKLDS